MCEKKESSMMYYRVAWKSNRSSVWQWKSTKLTSLQALFGFLRMYSAIPQDHLRVFSSLSLEGMDEMLMRENKGWESTSITAEEFLRERRIQIQERTQRASEQYPERGAIAVTTRPLVDESSPLRQSLSKWNGSVLERRRAEVESGAGGDHDMPYTFSLPVFMPQTLAWTRLLVKVQRGELEL
jgi:hypothetical protein